MAITVAEKEHWRNRIEVRIDRRIERLVSAEDPTFLQELTKQARARAYKELGIDKSGYKLIFHVERGGGQLVFHLHLHLLGGWKR